LEDPVATPRVYADFQNLDDHNRVRLICAGTAEDLRRLALQLREGLALTLYTDDADDEGNPDPLLIDGTVHYDAEGKCWVAEVDWSRLRHASDEARRNGQPLDSSSGLPAAETRHPAT
jgi:hypothetical protein